MQNPFFLSIRRQISEWNLQITWNLTRLLVNKDHLILKSGKKRSEATIQILFLLLLKTNSSFNQNVHINFGVIFDGIILLWHYSKTGDAKMLCSFVLCKQYNAKSISWLFMVFSRLINTRTLPEYVYVQLWVFFNTEKKPQHIQY